MKFNKSASANTISRVNEKSLQASGKLLQEIPIDAISENPKNRSVFSMDSDGIDALAETISQFDFTTPIEVFELPEGGYQVYSGHRRLTAMKQLGRETIAAIVHPYVSEIDATSRMIAGNVFNRELTPIEWARAIDTYIKDVIEKRAMETGVRPGSVEQECLKFFGIKVGRYRKYRNLIKLIPELQELANRKDFPYVFFSTEGVMNMPDVQQYELYEILSQHFDEAGNFTLTTSEIHKIIFRIKGITVEEEPLPTSMGIESVEDEMPGDKVYDLASDDQSGLMEELELMETYDLSSNSRVETEELEQPDNRRDNEGHIEVPAAERLSDNVAEHQTLVERQKSSAEVSAATKAREIDPSLCFDEILNDTNLKLEIALQNKYPFRNKESAKQMVASVKRLVDMVEKLL